MLLLRVLVRLVIVSILTNKVIAGTPWTTTTFWPPDLVFELVTDLGPVWGHPQDSVPRKNRIVVGQTPRKARIGPPIAS